ncbi:DUF4253 domain-containing protein [Campylobacter geochelonis]|uniref:DUF4253 domain-containing protein n=1 Tax=Campylobacter geochelonis TaxID=1780362 RepID=UPI0007709808|nr:DUF4253 domain-containing protein [Campylobacter geochelonis]CZE51324.1 Uncharacterised protein [Campylobacter geochelonis]
MSEITDEMIKTIGCECEVFEAGLDDDMLVMKAYFKELELGKKRGFMPVILSVSDTLLEALQDTLSLDSPKSVLSAKMPNARAEFTRYFNEIKDNKEVIGKFKSSAESLNQPISIWNHETKLTKKLILAKIPVKNPWEIFAYLPFGGWNSCPDALTMMAVAKLWFEKYGAVPCAISSDELEFFVGENPPKLSKDELLRLACEHHFFCTDRVEQCSEDGTIGSLAKELEGSTFWYFWWD